MQLCNLTEIRQLMERHGIAPRKSFGQNFLINSQIPEEIADTSAYAPFQYPENEGGQVCALEIGPGIGALTEQLAIRYPAVTAVEIDDRLIPVLAETLAIHQNVTVLHGDFLKLDVRDLITSLANGGGVHVCANLPYYVTTPILKSLLDAFPPAGTSPIRRITLLVQSEFADRMCAGPGDSDYSATSVLAALHGVPRRRFTVSAGNFFPVPKVSSAVLTLELYPNGLLDLFSDTPAGDAFPPFWKKLNAVVEAAFAARRKALPNALSAFFPKEKTADALTALGFPADLRGEKLSALDFCRLTASLMQ